MLKVFDILFHLSQLDAALAAKESFTYRTHFVEFGNVINLTFAGDLTESAPTDGSVVRDLADLVNDCIAAIAAVFRGLDYEEKLYYRIDSAIVAVVDIKVVRA